ncbi:MAG TPA: hypothetical protein VNW90_19120 [Acetobacteraceae bacterium]|jgi:hypothetical protein|nr:hypothetical protein [Acetobacteraceae bacterium]
MTFDNVVNTRVAFATRRKELLSNWLFSHEVQGDFAHWAKRLEETNDAEMAFTRLVEGVR